MRPVAIIGTSHLAARLEKGVAARGNPIVRLPGAAFEGEGGRDLTFDGISQALRDVDLHGAEMVYLVDDRDERNLGVLMALVSIEPNVHATVSLFNESIAPHLRAANPNVEILNPAKIAAPTFIEALSVPLSHSLKYTPARHATEPPPPSDRLVRRLLLAFGAMIGLTVAYFHFADRLSWLDALYFVVVTVATVGYGDINLQSASTLSKLIGIALILGSTVFIWMIFSLTIDRIIKKRVQLALGRKRYGYSGHVILCGLGRLGSFIADGLLDRGERVIVLEREESSSIIDHLRRRGADVYIGDARLPRVLEDVGVGRAKALLSVINNDYTNLEIGLNARSFEPNLRLVLRIFDESMSRKIKENLDIHLTYSMTAIADERFLQTLDTTVPSAAAPSAAAAGRAAGA